MKRSFYEMLGITHDADQAQIDIAYRQVSAKFNAANLRGVTEAVIEAQLIREGYQILSNPEQRARYDAKLLESEPSANLTFLPDNSYGRRRLGIGTVVLVVLSAILGNIVYHNLSVKMDEVRVEHVQAVARHKDEQPKVIIETVHASPAMASAGPQKR